MKEKLAYVGFSYFRDMESNYPKWFKREIQVWQKQGEELVDEILIPEIDVSILQQYYSADGDDPIIDLILIDEDDVEFFNYILETEVEFDFDRYEYWLSAYTTDPSESKKDGGFMGLYPAPKFLPGFPDAKRLKPKLSE
ncbi:DUF7683 domain-containing protein [Mucilaginibacter agri]|uniref:DUF7683 domain-containing protein n=1 Tax=Mucilaginibacter agri TaxID=2695265 RepID=A0A966DTI1_9SPHI|nr:hypothetical protein [Mucilaginibacter agri]NCD70690.1 hypothetical protein [Mucilaginibacter agri]